MALNLFFSKLVIFVFLQNVKVKVMKKALHVSDISNRCFKTMKFNFEFGLFPPALRCQLWVCLISADLLQQINMGAVIG